MIAWANHLAYLTQAAQPVAEKFHSRAALIVVAAAVVVLVLLWATAWQHRRHAAQTEPRLCPSCGTSQPAFARFCRRCGRRL